MKLILLILLIICLTVDGIPLKFLQEQFPFPPQFQTHNSGVFTTDSTLYLPPEAHTTAPYFPIKNINNLPFQYLPPTGTKAPAVYPTSFPLFMSLTSTPYFDDFNEDENKGNGRIRMSNTTFSPSEQYKLNRTNKNNVRQTLENREMRSITKPVNFQQPIDRIDIKFPHPLPSNIRVTTPHPVSQNSSTRRMIISAQNRKDQVPDQSKETSFQAPKYLPPPGFFISSTTEPAIPILRLSNEMDLDGSFSYEVLGADQTHYVQNSRMENVGTDKEEQVVEGSYSYVGDNGETYTVHYIADSNGFRATGDHLPVAPPVPEIIQRAVQYNLAEEAKKPPHLKWQYEEKDYRVSDSEKSNNYATLPPRNLFTGRTPEAFSYNVPQGSNILNNLATAASSQIPIKTNIDLTNDQLQVKVNNGPISPQITFLASQGAHVPSISTAQQSIARMFTTEKSTLPRLINYEAGIKESEDESNKALWRWQYGLSGNNDNHNQMNTNKNTISRSFSEGDDVVINFNDMTQEQYSKIIQSQFQTIAPDTTEKIPFSETIQTNENESNNMNNYHQNQNIMETDNQDTKYLNYDYSSLHGDVKEPYDYKDNFKEPQIIKSLDTSMNTKHYKDDINSLTVNNYYDENKLNITSTEPPIIFSTVKSIKFSDFIVHDSKDGFKPLINTNTPSINEKQTTETTTEIMEEMLKNNIFLKTLITNDKNQYKNNNKHGEETKQQNRGENNIKPNVDKISKFIRFQTKSFNDLKEDKKKHLDISEILNYVTLKNHFESNKIRPKPMPSIDSNNLDKNNEIYFLRLQERKNSDKEEGRSEINTNNSRTSLNNQDREELRGIIKNYKILQRNNNLLNREQNSNNNNNLRINLTPSPLKLSHIPNLPPLGRAGPMMKSYLPPMYV